MPNVYNKTTVKLSDLRVNDDNELLVADESGTTKTLTRTNLIARTTDLADDDTVSSSIITLDNLRFRREYKGIAIQARYVEDIDTSSVVSLSLIFYHPTLVTVMKIVTNAIVLSSKDQVETYYLKSDEMNFARFRVIATESGGGDGVDNIEVDLIY